MNADEYKAQLIALLPPGPAWNVAPEGARDRLIAALAEEYARADGRAGDLLQEADPATVSELLPDWEELLGLSGEGTEAERRGAVIAQLAAVQEQTTAAYEALAAALGVAPITIFKFTAFRVGHSAVGSGIGGSAWIYTWEVHAPAATTAEQRAALETLFNRVKRAHSIVVFEYDL